MPTFAHITRPGTTHRMGSIRLLQSAAAAHCEPSTTATTTLSAATADSPSTPAQHDEQQILLSGQAVHSSSQLVLISDTQTAAATTHPTHVVQATPLAAENVPHDATYAEPEPRSQ